MGLPSSRRVFLADFGRTTAGILLLAAGLSGCSRDDETAGEAVSPLPSTVPPASAGALQVGTVDLGFVAAYVVARGGQATLIDTGVEDSEGSILEVLRSMGFEWGDVGDVIVTHSHGDHAGSLAAVAEAAEDASLYAGGPDIPSMDARREITAVGDGDKVFDLNIVETPGHTPGHISVVDPASRRLFTGDAFVGADGELAGPSAQFTADMSTAAASVTKLAAMAPEQIYVAHGFPASGSAAELIALAESL